METNKKSFRDELRIMAEIAELIEKSTVFPKDNFKIDIQLEKENFKNLISNFRDIDRNNNSFSILLDKVEFRFFLKK